MQQEIEEIEWVDCRDKTITDCVSSSKPPGSQKAQNPTPNPTLCGEIYLVRVETPAFAYRGLVQDDYRVLEGVGINIECQSKEGGKSIQLSPKCFQSSGGDL